MKVIKLLNFKFGIKELYVIWLWWEVEGRIVRRKEKELCIEEEWVFRDRIEYEGGMNFSVDLRF